MFFKLERWMTGAAIVAIGFWLVGCASSSMNVVPEGQVVRKADSGKALVYFVRPSSFGGAVQAPVFDDETYIGTVSANTHVAYQAAPGHHMFMIVGENADFMEATLLPGKIYYAEVMARFGVMKARFSLRPQNGQIPDNQVNTWVTSSTRQVTPNEKGFHWARAQATYMHKLKEQDLPRWQAKAENDKQILRPESGK
jgi:hypothetical protein